MFNPVVFLTPEVVEIDGKSIISLHVSESSQVHRFKNKIFDRAGDADNNITNSYHLIENMFLRKSKASSETNVCPFLTLDELDESSFKKMRAHISIYNPAHPWLEMSSEDMLRSAGFWRRDPITNQEGYILAVALLFGKEQTILNYCQWHRTDAIYRNMTYKRFLNPLPTDPDVRYNDRDMVCVNLIESYVRLMNFIERNMPDVFALDERGINRLDLRNMLFREIVSNLLLHREFASTFSSKLLIFSDRVITENWTKPMQIGDVTLDTLETHTKNPLITKVFREMKWAEELGSGKKNIKKFAPLYYDKYKIEIQNNEKFVFSITYRDVDEDFNENEKELRTQAEELKQEPSDQATKRLSDQVTKQKQILDFCLTPKDMKDIMNLLGHKHKQTFRLNYIKPLIEEELLSMTFPENPNHRDQKYITTEKGKGALNL
jgi:ATP-dependent DNA helicase RecG